MKHRGYKLKRGLTNLPLEARLVVIGTFLDAGVLTPQDRRELLMNPELLAAAAEFFLMHPFMADDKHGCSYLALKRGKRAYRFDQFLKFLQQDRKSVV
jgi:hypothetical protein